MKSPIIWRMCWPPGVGRSVTCLLAGFLSLADLSGATDAPAARVVERILVANDTCPDVTWGWTEEQTRQAFADLVRSHLDEMLRTEDDPPESRDHFNMATTQEALDFVARYPARKEELALPSHF
jgi:hypothetical protein